MVRTILIITVFNTLFLGKVLAQPDFQKIKEARLAYVLENIALEEEQKVPFETLYNEFYEKKGEINTELRELRQNSFRMTTTDEELENAIDKMLALRQEELTLAIDYKDKFLEVINIRQLAELYRSEVEFRKNLLKRVTEE